MTDWKLEQLPKFVTMQRPSDQAAVEITGNTRLFHGAVSTHVKRVVSVNPNRLQVVTRWVKKPDPNDATGAQVASLTQTQPSAERAGNSRGIRI